MQRVPAAVRLLPANQQPGGEGRSGGGSGQLHYDHQDAAASAEVEFCSGRVVGSSRLVHVMVCVRL